MTIAYARTDFIKWCVQHLAEKRAKKIAWLAAKEEAGTITPYEANELRKARREDRP